MEISRKADLITMSDSNSTIDLQILQINQTICKNIDTIETAERGFISQNILSQLRTFVEHIMLKVWKHPGDVQDSYSNIRSAIAFARSRGNLKFLRRFHDYLQIVASHYALDEENSERVMLKYYEFLIKLRSFLRNNYDLDVLQNLEKFPVNTDPGLKQYYEKIALVLDSYQDVPRNSRVSDRYYIHKIKPFFVNQKVYYEVTFTPTNVNSSKFDRVIAFTSIEISGFYAAKLSLNDDHIEIMGRTMSIFVITDWEVSVRPCEIENFSKILGVHIKSAGNLAEYRNLMRFLTHTGFSLVEVVDLPDHTFNSFKDEVTGKRSSPKFLPVLDKCRDLSKNKLPGANIVRYLLLRLNNKIIKRQLDRVTRNTKLSNLSLKNGCKPFDDIPFNTSPIYHNPKISDLFKCIGHENREHELFARFIQNNTEIRGKIYTSIDDCSRFTNVKNLVDIYNEKLWTGHQGRVIKEFHNHFYISEYQENTLFALRELKKLASSGIKNYISSVDSWLNSNVHLVDCDEKKNTLRHMFESSKVALIYGPAGTGKSTLINHASHFFSKYKKKYLANTNPAIHNLRRKVDASNTHFSTIAKFLKSSDISNDYDLIFIDECSTVSNRDIKDILNRAKFRLLVLVGDIFQIESIRFGNWFSAARDFLPRNSVFELEKPYRSDNRDLLELWRKVRAREDTIVEHIAKNKYSRNLDLSVFDTTEDEEIILCLNYDGLYGINCINRFLQESNSNPVVSWGVHNYKVNDPVLFNESNRFFPLIYNNMKGKILGLEILEGRNEIQFDIELEKAISGMDAEDYNFTLLENSINGNSVIRFTVDRYKSTDEDDDNSDADVVPFQVAYAVSIHKAQGLEYESVKIIITDQTDELITHNIFYTAITRARKRLKIYWSPEVEKRVLERFESKKNNKDVSLLKLCAPDLVSS